MNKKATKQDMFEGYGCDIEYTQFRVSQNVPETFCQKRGSQKTLGFPSLLYFLPLSIAKSFIVTRNILSFPWFANSSCNCCSFDVFGKLFTYFILSFASWTLILASVDSILSLEFVGYVLVLNEVRKQPGKG